MLRLSLILLALSVLPAQAHAAEGFLGVTEQGRLVGFTSQQPFALSTPVSPRGLAAGERIVALGTRPGGVVGVGSSARLYGLDPATGRATPIGEPFPQGLRGSRFSLAVAPGAAVGRLLSDVGQDLVVDLSTGATTPGPGLRRADNGAQLRPSGDIAADGSLVGVQLGPTVLVRETAPGSAAMTVTRLEDPRVPIGEPTGFQLGADGRGYLLAVLSDRQRERQSAMVVLDPAAGMLIGGITRGFKYLGRRLDTFTSLGTVPDDRTAPQARVTLARTISARTLLANRLPMRVHTSEAAQVVVSLRVRGQGIGFNFSTRDTPGTLSFPNFQLTARDKTRVRRAIGARIRIVIGVNDLKGNRRSLVRTARLVR